MNEIKVWMETHPDEYAQFTARIENHGLEGIMKLGEEAFLSSPKFKKEIEKMMKSDSFDSDSLLQTLLMSDFTSDYFRKKDDNRMAMAAWIRYGESPELILDGLDDAIVSQGKRKYRELFSKLHRLFLGKFYYRYNAPHCEYYYQKYQASSNSSFQTLLVSHDEDLVKRIGEWAMGGGSGMAVAHLFVALVEVGEISSKLPLTKFLEAMKESYPKHPSIGVRQLQKNVCYLQSLSPNKKQYGKDELEHRFEIDLIKSEVLLVKT